MNGIVFKVIKNRNYSVISNRHFFQKNMSWQAKGMLDAMLSVPDNWHFSIEGLVQMSSNGRASVRATLQELTDLGYIRIEQGRNEKGQITSVYYIYETPIGSASDGDAGDDSTPSNRTENISESTNKTTVSAEFGNRTQCENQTMSENRTGSETMQNSDSESPVSAKCENRTRLETPPVSPRSISRRGFSDAVNRTQSNTETKYINKNNIYTVCSQNRDSIYPSSVSSAEADRMREDFLMTSLKKRIGYEWLADRFPIETLDYILGLMTEIYRTGSRQIRIGGVLRSVKDIRTKLDRLDADQLCYVLNCYKAVTTPIRSLRSYLLTALYNAPISYGEHKRKEEEQAKLAAGNGNAVGSFDTNEFFEAAVRRSFQRSDGGWSAP